MANQALDLESKVYFKKHIEKITNLNIQTLRRMWTRNEFPQPKYIGNRLAWSADTIDQWIEDTLQGEK
jgi:predicted DNA-binding transcriptional regulator AlpA